MRFLALRILESAHFDFYDGSREVAFVTGTGRSNTKRILGYSEGLYQIAKEQFQAFLNASDLRLKISLLADALNVPSRDEDYLTKLSFFMRVCWYFNMEA